MNILAISSILPIPGYVSDNDFVFQTYLHYRHQFPRDRIVVLKPVKYNLNLLTALRGTSRLRALENRKRWNIHGFHVEIIPFIAAWRWRNAHALVCRSAFWLNRSRIRQLFENHTFDLIHAQFIFADGLLAKTLGKRYGIPYLVTTHNETFYFEHQVSRRISLNVLKGASAVLPINHNNSQYFISLGLKNVELSPLGFNRDFIRPQKKTGGSKVRILTVAALIQLKNIHQVIQAVATLNMKYPVEYTIVGDGPERKNLELLVEKLGLGGIVRFKGAIPHEQVADEMYLHDVFIMPSYFETFGRVFFEAMAMGIPIICAKNSGIHGLFKEGQEGLSVDHRSVMDISRVLEFLIERPENRKAIGLGGKALVEEYTWENVARKLHQNYKQALQV